jgi:hypothetical protein
VAEAADPYWKLRAPRGPAPDELCACPNLPPVALQAHLAFNPVICMRYHREVEPSKLGFGAELADTLYQWQSFHDCFYILWLDSGEFEAWAKAQLLSPDSPVNVRALEVVQQLKAFREAYYWWFVDSCGSADQASSCPRCRGSLTLVEGQRVCASCSVVVPQP